MGGFFPVLVLRRMKQTEESMLENACAYNIYNIITSYNQNLVHVTMLCSVPATFTCLKGPSAQRQGRSRHAAEAGSLLSQGVWTDASNWPNNMG